MEAADVVAEELLCVEAELQDVQGQIQALLDRQVKLCERQSELKALLEECEASQDAVHDNRTTSTDDWSSNFEWDSRAEDVGFNVFGITSYRANQREIINAVMSGRDVLVIMAAGGGKSLCYQLPALLRDGVSLVVSPLLSLIQDQVLGLTTLGVSAYMLTSTTSKENEKLIYNALDKGEMELKLLYVTPEKISKSKRFMSKLEKCHRAGRLSLIAIDEAHCCSQWGHDFRPDYKNLGILKIQFANVPLIALTATATCRVQVDLMDMLHIPKCVKFVSTVNRPNLFYRVREKSSVGKVVIDEIADFIRGTYSKNDSGIVYCFSRKECEQVAKELRGCGISADHYHADMDVIAREKVHLRWSTNKLQVIVATVAFGMGINKPDVRFVVHHSLSKSMETYYQESGRAGRDGLPSDCVLYYRSGDVPRQSSMVFYENTGLQNLYDIVRYCQSKKNCRRGAFFRHFAEPPKDCNGMCDNCAHETEVKELDASNHAKLIVSLLHELQENDQRATMLQLVERFKVKIRELGTSSPAPDLKKEEIEQMIVQLLLDHVLKEEFQHTAYATNSYLALGSLWKLVSQGKKQVILEISTRQHANGMPKNAKRTRMSQLELKLDELRKELSSSNTGVLPHAILSSQQISTLGAQKPTSLAYLEKLIGKVKTEKYGERIIDLIQEYLKSEQGNDGATGTAKDTTQECSKKQKNKHVVLVESSEDDQ
ncbi:ATP-dependent DNA helicase Q-like 2 isoform X1 [Zingiber officinale]|uniref:ATP-dependent DNA helicase Q-like 2 isoform X1 n=1 Tax=Zingiber officinale TaxID=94328 RepID=UPI001C4BF9EE|nr:ATP-dependent DNA helicase Q-like 2 isoform X1 [Zingiber officinale]